MLFRVRLKLVEKRETLLGLLIHMILDWRKVLTLYKIRVDDANVVEASNQHLRYRFIGGLRMCCLDSCRLYTRREQNFCQLIARIVFGGSLASYLNE